MQGFSFRLPIFTTFIGSFCFHTPYTVSTGQCEEVSSADIETMSHG